MSNVSSAAISPVNSPLASQTSSIDVSVATLGNDISEVQAVHHQSPNETISGEVHDIAIQFLLSDGKCDVPEALQTAFSASLHRLKGAREKLTEYWKDKTKEIFFDSQCLIKNDIRELMKGVIRHNYYVNKDGDEPKADDDKSGVLPQGAFVEPKESIYLQTLKGGSSSIFTKLILVDEKVPKILDSFHLASLPLSSYPAMTDRWDARLFYISAFRCANIKKATGDGCAVTGGGQTVPGVDKKNAEENDPAVKVKKIFTITFDILEKEFKKLALPDQLSLAASLAGFLDSANKTNKTSSYWFGNKDKKSYDRIVGEAWQECCPKLNELVEKMKASSIFEPPSVDASVGSSS